MTNKCDNWKMVFGNDMWTWFLPICPREVIIDPHNFPKKHEMVMQDYQILIHSSAAGTDKDNSI